MDKIQILLLSLFLILMSGAVSAENVTPVYITGYNYTSGMTQGYGINKQYSQGQGWNLTTAQGSQNYYLTSIEVYSVGLYNTPTGHIRMEVHKSEMNDSHPIERITQSTNNFTPAEWATEGWKVFNFDGTLKLNSSDRFWLIMNNSDGVTGANYYMCARRETDVYDRGHIAQYDLSNHSWIPDISRDGLFKVYGVPAGEPNITIECGVVITGDTVLENDLINCHGSGLGLGANDITLDCAGHTVDGDNVVGGFGIYSQNWGGVTIKNCNINEFEVGILVIYNSGNSILDNNITNAGAIGIVIGAESDDNVVRGNNIENSVIWGIMINRSSYNVISNNNLISNIYGVWLQDNSWYNTFWNNTFIDNVISANETRNSNNNDWNLSDIGNYWSDFESNPGYPNYYNISGPGDGVDWHPIWELADSDNDSVADDIDHCINTTLPETFRKLAPNHYADMDGDFVFETRSRPKDPLTDSEFDMQDTYGCSCTQILELEQGDSKGKGKGKKGPKKGCSLGTMREFINSTA